MQTQTRKNDQLIISQYRHSYRWKDDPGAGFGFPCDADGNIDVNDMSPAALENWEFCQTSDAVVDLGVQSSSWIAGTFCSCGSGNLRHALYDVQGIFLRYVCDHCEESAKRKYAPHVFSGYGQAFLDEYSRERIEEDY